MKIIDADTLINEINRVLPDWSEEKEIILDTIANMPSITICKDFTVHYENWRDNFNPNQDDCCNLRGSK